MASLWLDNFSAYGVGGQARMLDGIYAEVQGTIVADPDFSATGEVLKFAHPAAGFVVRKVLDGPKTTVGVASRIWLSNLPQNENVRTRIVSFRDIGNTVLCHVMVDPSGYLHVHSGAATTGNIVASSAAPVMIANAWRHIETKCEFDDTTGSIEIRSEGVTVLTASGINTSPSGNQCHNVVFHNQGDGTSVGPDLYVKDLIIWDTTTGFNNDFFGTCFVASLVPDADVSFNWVASTGLTGFNRINFAPPTDDGSYDAADATPPAASLFNLSDLPIDAIIAKAVMTLVRAKKTDGGDANLQVGLKSGGSTGLGANRPITTAYTYWSDIFDVDPATSAGWTVAAVNALELQLDRTL